MLAITIGTFAGYASTHALTAQIAAPFIKATIYFVTFASGLLSLVYAFALLRRRLTSDESQFLLFSAVSVTIAFMLSLSWPAFEAMVIPGLAFLVSALLEMSSKTTRYIYCGISLALICAVTNTKLNSPFGFSDWLEPSVVSASETSHLAGLQGLRLPASSVAMLEGITRIIKADSSPNDTIFTYPSMPIFYGLSGRFSPAYSGDHNIDACPDDIARQDAQAILRAKPKVIIYYRQDPRRLRGDEILWRGGRVSGQRTIISAVETLIKEYRLAGRFAAPPTPITVDVYVRNKQP